jgi:hypothetical protein
MLVLEKTLYYCIFWGQFLVHCLCAFLSPSVGF